MRKKLSKANKQKFTSLLHGKPEYLCLATYRLKTVGLAEMKSAMRREKHALKLVKRGVACFTKYREDATNFKRMSRADIQKYLRKYSWLYDNDKLSWTDK